MAEINNKKSINLLPAIFRTEKNDKFLASTLDQYIKTPQAERLDSFAGSKITSTYNPKTDFYIDEGTTTRSRYQLEPALIIGSDTGEIKNAYGFDDLLNQIDYHGGYSKNIPSLFNPDFDSYDPCIDWDKFINYREYFWLTGGPDTVYINSVNLSHAKSEFLVNDSSDGSFFVFGQSTTTDPILYLYKGQTYSFLVNSTKKFFITTENKYSELAMYSNAAGNGTHSVTLIVDEFTPSTLFYTSDSSEVAGGRIVVREKSTDPILDIESDIIGKLHYELGNGVSLVNGLRVGFEGNVTPTKYKDSEYYVEGVGNGIKLINISELTTPEPIAEIINETFGTGGFGPFDVSKTVAVLPEYTTINRASTDRNPWSRYNRWFHRSAIEMAAKANNVEVVLSVDYRAKRPIIEFKSDIKLWKFGDYAITPVDLIDTITTDPFTDVQGGVGFIIDGIEVYDGMRVIFSAATDLDLKNKVYLLSTPVVNNVPRINLTVNETVTTGACVIVKKGNTRRGTEWWFNQTSWHRAQERTVINQPPLFDLYDRLGNSYSSSSVYNTSFLGNKLFSYAVGTGVPDPVLGFPLKYKNVGVEATFLFENYFSNSSFNVVVETTSNVPDVYSVNTSATYFNINGVLRNVWTKSSGYSIPIQQFQVVTSVVHRIPITVVDDIVSLYDAQDLEVDVFVNDVKLVPTTLGASTGFSVVKQGADVVVLFDNPINGELTPVRVLLKVFSKNGVPTGEAGYYETPVNLTNNPTNENIYQFTLSEVSDHIKTMANHSPDFVGYYPGYSNLNTLPEPIAELGSRLIKNNNPVTFAQFFLSSTDHNVISAIRTVAADYYQFKLNLIRQLSAINNTNITSPQILLDLALKEINKIKGAGFPYAHSDMLGYGSAAEVRNYVVSNIRNNQYPLLSNFTLSALSEQSVLVSKNGVTLLHGSEYEFSEDGSLLIVTSPLVRNDKIEIKIYRSTIGSFVPPTPSKLGLYPKFEPCIFVDNTYAGSPVKVIQGHDGSLTVALSEYNEPDDYRDIALLEFEKRIFNNIKVEYNSDLLNYHDVLPRASSVTSRDKYTQIYNVIYRDFINWCNLYGIDAVKNDSFDLSNYKTYNFRDSGVIGGSWRGVYYYYFDTDKPHTSPWEMLGFSIKPAWWESEYGPAPYSSANTKLWQDLQLGKIRQGDREGIDATYARPYLDRMIPVDTHGNLIDIRNWQIFTTAISPNADWQFGDFSPAEVAWRRSSLWAFEIQILMALTNPATYAAKMFDPSKMELNAVSQYMYKPTNDYISLKSLEVFSDIRDSKFVLSAGYSVLVVEAGYKRAIDYISILKSDLANTDVRLMYKAGGFLSKSKLNVIVDSVSPDTANPGVILPSDDYQLHFNVSSPVKTISISGMIISRSGEGFVIKGYDTSKPYFTVMYPERTRAYNTTVTVGGKSAQFYAWAEGKFYQYGQIVQYLSKYYRVRVGHNSGIVFDINNYEQIPSLPVNGGVTVLDAARFESTPTQVMYGTVLETVQAVYDVIIGYGYWLETQGFQFDEYVSDLKQVVNWKFSGKEFLFWVSQNWANTAVITISPFSNLIAFKFNTATVDNVLDSFYNYSILTANGIPMSKSNITVNRDNNLCTIATRGTADGIFFARLELVQKEHAIVLNNSSMFNDVIYDTRTGYRQSRIKLVGFKTSAWDGNYQSPGFMYDRAAITLWEPYASYIAADVVKHAGKYYSAKTNVIGNSTFDYSKWVLLGNKPVVQLLPNFDYKIDQFKDFYSLDIDNFDVGQQQMAQHLIGYTPREYLQNIFVNPIAQYKFYQGFIKEKGTKNAIKKLAKASIHNLQGDVEYTEEWAFRSGEYGGFTAYDEYEFVLPETSFYENSQVIKFIDYRPPVTEFESILYVPDASLTIKPDLHDFNTVVPTVSSVDVEFVLPVAGYARLDDVSMTAFNMQQLFALNTSSVVTDVAGIRTVIWVASTTNMDWDVYRCVVQPAKITSVASSSAGLMFITDIAHNLVVGDLVAVTGIDDVLDSIYTVATVNASDGTLKFFTSEVVKTPIPISLAAPAVISKLVSARVKTTYNAAMELNYGELVWVDADVNSSGKWAVYKKLPNFEWELVRVQTDIVDISGFEKAYIYNSVSTQIIDYLDIIDPLKGNVLGVADQEIRYKTGFDPAVYALGIDSVNVDLDSRWLDKHVGELWWDLSSIKYVWYEQGDIVYKKNNWGAAFPGSSIDVYEWVRTEYLPSQWAEVADTNIGLSEGISGQPKHADDTVYSARLVTDAVSGVSKAIYYYWVKRPAVIPKGVKGRRITASEVAQLLENPAGYGTPYMSPIDSSAIVLVNVKKYVQDTNVSLNFTKTTATNKVNRHTEWVLIDEGSDTSAPTARLNKKLIDSLMRSDILGNPVPDDTLPARQRYGIGIRPRQSMFVNPTEALRNVIEYANLVLSQYKITEMVGFESLTSSEEIPPTDLYLYDLIVEDQLSLSNVKTSGLKTADVSAVVVDGRIVDVIVHDGGSGYISDPEIKVIGDSSGAVLHANTVNGSIVSVTIKNHGEGFIAPPVLVVRDFSVIVTIDEYSNNRWALYTWNTNQWVKLRNQKYDVAQYWEYIDWAATTYDPLKPLFEAVDYSQLVASASVTVGNYIKVNNQGNGKYVILEKINNTGNVEVDYTIVYSELATIRFKDIVWKIVESTMNWDVLSYDKTFYDQYPTFETYTILMALKDEIFIGPLRVYWNKLFFKAVRYALSEQKFLDWAFKTSFINVKNKAGALEQRPVFKFQNSKYYEDYINEVKPYRTKLRSYQVDYDATDSATVSNTDFDCPAIYNADTMQFVIPTAEYMSTHYPHKFWYDNYTLHIDSIIIISGGSGFVSQPSVVITAAPGDTGAGASAIAYISLGSISNIVITNAGAGYTQPPVITLIGGGENDIVMPVLEVKLKNGKVRSFSTVIKFDRTDNIARNSAVAVSDEFVSSGRSPEFDLTWYASDNKSAIEVYVDGKWVISSGYSIVHYSSKDRYNYTKKYSRLVFPDVLPDKSIIKIVYRKNIELFNAIERLAYYNPVAGMPSADPADVMIGVGYNNITLDTLPLVGESASYVNWDENLFDSNMWDDVSNDAELSSIIDGGKLDYTTATGIAPTDVIFDGGARANSIIGDGFSNPAANPATEESVHAGAYESLAITVVSKSQLNPTKIVGFKQFTDILSRTHYKRIGAASTTTLTSELVSTSTYIDVADAAVLSPPSVVNGRSIPGIIFINGERIEFKQIDGNRLSVIRRGTLGTGAKQTHSIGSAVVDQGLAQTLPYADTYNRQAITITDTTEYTYLLSNFNFVDDGSASSQAEVRLAGKLLSKTGYYVHDIAASFDSPYIFGNINAVDTVDDLPTSYFIGTAFLVNSTNDVWVFTDSKSTNAVNGFIKSGMKWIPPEFDIQVRDSTTSVLTVSADIALILNTKLTVTQKIGKIWYSSPTSVSALADSTSEVAVFLGGNLASGLA